MPRQLLFRRRLANGAEPFVEIEAIIALQAIYSVAGTARNARDKFHTPLGVKDECACAMGESLAIHIALAVRVVDARFDEAQEHLVFLFQH